MISKSIDTIDKKDIDDLIDNEVREGRRIEYKSALPGKTDKDKEDKRKFLAGVSSFANAGGGDLLFGISEVEGVPKEAIGLDCNMDTEIQRLDNLIRDCLEPRIPGVRMVPIEGFPQGPVLLVRVPKSWAAPHMVTFRNLSRFFTRNSAGKHQMDVTEIRSAFLLSEALPEKIKRFRDERLGRIMADETPVPMDSDEKVVLHILPIASFSSSFSLEMRTLLDVSDKLDPMVGDNNRRINLDGFLTFSPTGQDQISYGYCQTFRGGQIESVHGGFTRNRSDTRVIMGGSLEELLIKACRQYFEALNNLEVPSPLVVLISMIGVSECCIATNESFGHVRRRAPIDRNILLLPDILVEEYESINDFDAVAKTLRPAFDALWNAGGYERSLSYDKDGNWNPPK